MLKSLTSAVIAAAAFGGVAVASVPASAMPMVDTTPAITAHTTGATVEDVRLVCGPFRCVYRPNYYGYGYRRPFYGYGYRRPVYGFGYGYGRYHHPYGYRRWHRW